MEVDVWRHFQKYTFFDSSILTICFVYLNEYLKISLQNTLLASTNLSLLLSLTIFLNFFVFRVFFKVLRIRLKLDNSLK
jgi:hypothetical protein